MAKPVCAVVGIGPGNGAASARRFAAEGFAVALLARSVEYAAELADELGGESAGARSYTCDVTDRRAIQDAFAAIREQLGEVEVLVYNAGSGAFGSIDDVTPEAFEEAWRINALGALLTVEEVLPAMKEAGRGNIVIIGATASLRGGANFAAFASAKAAQRSLGQSMSRHLGKQGIHVSLVIIDGVIDIPRTRAFLPDKPDSFFLKPDDIADTTFRLTQQEPSAWTFEIDLRPAAEQW